MFYDYHSFRLSVFLGLQYPVRLEVPVPAFSLLKPTGYPKDPVGMWRNGHPPSTDEKGKPGIYILGNVPFPGRIRVKSSPSSLFDAGIEKCTVCAGNSQGGS